MIEERGGHWNQLAAVVDGFHQVENHGRLFCLQTLLCGIQVKVNGKRACLVSLCAQCIRHASNLVQYVARIRWGLVA